MILSSKRSKKKKHLENFLLSAASEIVVTCFD